MSNLNSTLGPTFSNSSNVTSAYNTSSTGTDDSNTMSWDIEIAHTYSENTFYIRIPTIVLLSIFMPLGIIGNASVIYVYGFCMKRNNVQFFIMVLACFDIVSCSIGMPLELFELHFMYDYPSGVICQIQRFINYSASIGSALIHLSIATERYVKVCHPLKKQLSMRHCKFIVLGIVTVCIPLASPIAFSYDRKSEHIGKWYTVQCAFDFSHHIFLYYISFLPVCALNFITMFYFYFCVLRTARHHFKQLQARRKETSKHVSGISSATQGISRTSLAVFTLTVVYVLSFTPTLIIGTITKFFSKVDYTPVVQGTLILFYRSWAINSSTNPIIYGLFNNIYRDILVDLCKRCICMESSGISQRRVSTVSTIDG